MNSLGHRLAILNFVYGHPESTFMNVNYFLQLHPTRAMSHSTYRHEMGDILQHLAGAYPDTRASTALAQLECCPGGDVHRARKYCAVGLQRATRPRGYEVALIYAGKLLPALNEAASALQTALDLLVKPVIPVLGARREDRFPFASKQRWIYKYQTLGFLAEVLRERCSGVSSEYAREMNRIREQVLLVRWELKKKLEKMGIPGVQENFKCFLPTTIDEMLFELLDPEIILEQEEFMKRRQVEEAEEEIAQMGVVVQPVQQVGRIQGGTDYIEQVDVPLMEAYGTESALTGQGSHL
jgi:hypothetical protein